MQNVRYPSRILLVLYPMKKPRHQILITFIITNGNWLLAGMFALGGLLGVIVDAREIISVRVAIIGTIIVVFTLILIQTYLRLRGLDWVTNNGILRIRKLQPGLILPAIGVIILLWLPQLIPQTESKSAPESIVILTPTPAQTASRTPIPTVTNTFEPTLTQTPSSTLTRAPTATALPTPTPLPTPTVLPLAKAAPDELLIVITTFYNTRADSTDAHNKIKRDIERKIAELNIQNVRVEIETNLVLAVNDREKAQELGEFYDAIIVIWGEETGVNITVNFLNIRDPNVYIDYEELLILANSDSFAQVVVEELPGQLTFLSLFTIGQIYEVKGDDIEAIHIIEKALDSLPLESLESLNVNQGILIEPIRDALIYLGYLYMFSLEDYDRGLEYYNQALAVDPNHAFTYNFLGMVYHSKGDLNAAIEAFTQAIIVDPNFIYAYSNRGDVYRDIEDWESAFADYNRAIDTAPEEPSGYYWRGNAYYENGNLEAAMTDYNHAIAIDPNWVYPYESIGDIHQENEDWGAAIEAYTQAITIDPNYVYPYIKLADIYRNNGDLETSISILSQATLSTNDASVYVKRGDIYRVMGNLESAMDDYDQAIAINSREFSAYSNRGSLHIANKNWVAAITDFDQAIMINPDYAYSYWSRGYAYHMTGDYDQAATDFEHFLILEPNATGTIREYIDSFLNRYKAEQETP